MEKHLRQAQKKGNRRGKEYGIRFNYRRNRRSIARNSLRWIGNIHAGAAYELCVRVINIRLLAGGFWVTTKWRGKVGKYMEDIMEQYGQGCLWMLSGAVLMALFLSFLQEGGIINEIVQRFILGICG